jgi:hypothetical protein
MEEKEVTIHINSIGFFGDHFEIIDLWMLYYGDSFINKENIEIAKNKKYHVFYDKKKSEWKYANNQRYGWLLSRKGFDGCIVGIVEEDENVAKTNAASDIFTIRKELNKKERKPKIVTTFASYVEKCKKTYTKSEYDTGINCPMHKPFCIHACEFYEKSNNICGFKCPNPEYYGNCSRCSHSYRLQFTDRVYEMCGYGIVKILRR